MKTYLAKTEGGEIKAIQLTESFSKNAEALALMPSGFKVLDRVSPQSERFIFRGQRGKLDHWFILEPAPGNGHFLCHGDFEAQFHIVSEQTRYENELAFDLCQIQDALGCHCEDYRNQEAIMGRISGLIAKEDELHKLKESAGKHPQQNALEFELAIKEVIAEKMAKGLTVTEAVGTLQLCSMDIASQLFNPQPTLKDAFN